jgi:sugar phosphate isomerase/epimerase
MVAGVAMAQGAPNAEKLGWRLGCQAYSFNKFTFFEAVDKTASMGLKYIEAYPGQKLSPEKKDVVFDHNAPDDVLNAVKDKLNSAGVKMVAYGVVDLGKDEASARKVFDFAKKMGIETIVSEPKSDQFAMLDKLTEEYGINIAIHNHPKPSTYWSYDTEVKALDKASKRIGACADTGHWMRSGLDSLQGLKNLEGRIVSLHFKDLNEKSPKAHDVHWGTGVCDAKAMLAELKRQGFKGVFSIEYEYNWDNSVPDITKCVEWFDKTAAELSK